MYLTCLSLDLTRRCNLGCDFCFRGKPQNLDMSRETIDKILDEISNDSFVEELRILGGEPFLVPELVEYLVDQVIKKRLKIATAYTFSNATIKSRRVIEALNRLGVYLDTVPSDIHFRFADKPKAKVGIMLSTTGHNNHESIDGVFDFASELANEYVHVERQGNGKNSLLTIEGGAEDNFNKLIFDISPLRFGHFTRRINEFWFIADDIVLKTVSIASNGNAYLGSSASYATIDKKPIFNIIECDGDFFDRLIEFCWLHPISDKANYIRERYATALFFQKKRIELDDLKRETFNSLKVLNDLTLQQEKYANKVHAKYGRLTLGEVELIASTLTLIDIIRGGYPPTLFDTYLESCTRVPEGTFSSKDFTLEFGYRHIEGILLHACERAKKEDAS
ncbi:MAG: radical SAM protein [Clostridia bacterium]|nr:radical SAM protein [Clostridia bacterium]